MEAAYPDNPMLAEDLISKYLFIWMTELPLPSVDSHLLLLVRNFLRKLHHPKEKPCCSSVCDKRGSKEICISNSFANLAKRLYFSGIDHIRNECSCFF